MIFYLDSHPTKCASYYAVDHLRLAARAAIQVLSDATRSLAEECRIISMEKQMRDVRVEVQHEKHWASIEAHAPFPLGDTDTPLVRWVTESQDAWDWMLEFATDLVHEERNWSPHGVAQEHVDATCWLRVHAPRPVNAGRILERHVIFPLPSKMPKEFTTPDLHARDVPYATKMELVVRASRLLYFAKYRNSVRYTRGRTPRWWAAMETSLDFPALASTALET